MILSNTAILRAIKKKQIKIGKLTGTEKPGKPPFNTTSVDLKLSSTISVPRQKGALAVDLRDERNTKIADLLRANCENVRIGRNRPLTLDPGMFVLGATEERVDFGVGDACDWSFAARVEGKSSRARCGLIVHCTAPIIHAGFEGPITLEIANLSTWPFLLYPGMYICQIVIEEVLGEVVETGNQFKGQNHPTG